MRITEEKLNQGEWIHIFPEGKVYQNGTLKKPLRWGVGKLVETSKVTPWVLPFYHIGMEQVMPLHQHIPRPFGKEIDVLFDKPMIFDDVLKEHRKKGSTKEEIYIDITKRIEDKLSELEIRTKEIRAQFMKTT
jgi:monolysocardiolipin acyltransferase